MPLTHVAMRSGRSEAYRRAVLDGIHRAMRDIFEAPEDRATIAEHDAAGFRRGLSRLGIGGGDEVLVIQITTSAARSARRRTALFRLIADRLAADPGVRREDVVIDLVEVAEGSRLEPDLGHYG